MQLLPAQRSRRDGGIPIRKDQAEMAEEEKDEKSEDGPSTEDIEKMKAALKKANDEAAKYRHDAKEKDDELAKLKQAQDSSKSEMDKVREQIQELSQRAEKAEREALVAKVAQAKKLPAALAGRLSGSTQDELEADADSLIESLGLNTDDSETEDSEEDEKPEDQPLGGRPKEKLRPGASNDDEGSDFDGGKVADKLLSESSW